MARMFWLKLYVEILSDPKVARLPDRVWRRMIEFFLLACKHGQEGALPSLSDMAWELRASPDELQSEIEELIKINVLTNTINGQIVVTHFSARQAPSSAAERQKAYRERTAFRQYKPEEIERESKMKAFNREVDITEAFDVYATVTGHMAFQRDSQADDVYRIGQVVKQHGAEGAIEYLKPYFAAWCKRKGKDGKTYSKTNTAWLDWAVAGEIPEEHQQADITQKIGPYLGS